MVFVGSSMPQRTQTRPRGFALIWCLVYLIAFAALCSLAVDLGRVQLAKTELMRAAEAAARAGAAQLGSGTATAQATAISVAAQNTVDGNPLVLQAADIQCGYYDSTNNTFTTATSNYNAVRVTAKCLKSRGTGISLTWGKVVGADNCDVTAVAMATFNSTIPYGIIGYNSITVNKSMFAASYNSSVTSNPSTTTYYSNCLLESNGPITDSSSQNVVKGTVAYGPAGSVDASITRTATTPLSANISKPVMPSFTPISNPYGLGSVQTGTSFVSATLPGGTYYFTQISCGNSVAITFAGPTTIYLDGNVTMNDACQWIAYNNDPANLTIYMNAGYTFQVHSNCTIVGRIVAPDAYFVCYDSFELDGTMCFKTISAHDNFMPFLDERLINASGSGTIALTQ